MLTTIWHAEYNNQPHTVRLEYNNLISTISIFLDERAYLNNKLFWYLSKNIYQFSESGHTFAFHKSGITIFDMKFSLVLDNREIPPISVTPPTIRNSLSSIIPNAPPPPTSPPVVPYVPPASAAPPASPPVQIVGQGPLTETTEIVGRDEYPLDNSYGKEVLSIEQEVSRTIANEISVSHEVQLTASANFDILAFIKADLAAQFTRQTGVKINDTVTRRQTIKFSAGAQQFVIYTVVWKRRVSQGVCYVNMQGTVQPIPYQVAFDLSFEIASRLGNVEKIATDI